MNELRNKQVKKDVQVPVVQMLDCAIHRINHYPADKYYGNQLRYSVDRDLSTGWRYPCFEQLGPGRHFQSNGYRKGILSTGSKKRTTVCNFTNTHQLILSTRKKVLLSTFIFIVRDIQDILNFLSYESIWLFQSRERVFYLISKHWVFSGDLYVLCRVKERERGKEKAKHLVKLRITVPKTTTAVKPVKQSLSFDVWMFLQDVVVCFVVAVVF